MWWHSYSFDIWNHERKGGTSELLNFTLSLLSSDHPTEVSSSNDKTAGNQRTLQVNAHFKFSFWIADAVFRHFGFLQLLNIITWFWRSTDIITMGLGSKRAALTITPCILGKVWPGHISFLFLYFISISIHLCARFSFKDLKIYSESKVSHVLLTDFQGASSKTR